jgi:calcineurin-like phosphoesterase family protein
MKNSYYNTFDQVQEKDKEDYIPRTWFTSDTHFRHANIIKYCDRPFANVEEMDEGLILRWNACVHPADVIYHLGDVGFNYGSLFHIVPRLNGQKYLVLGNHDWSAVRMEALGFACLTHRRNELHTQIINDRKFVMAHRPRDLPTYDPKKFGKWDSNRVVLCGHEHNNAPMFIRWVRDKGDVARPVMALNLSCEHTNYAPISLERVIEAYDAHVHSYIQGLGERS